MLAMANGYSLQMAPRAQRARGQMRLAFAKKQGETRLADVFQEGSLKVRFPRGQDAAFFEAVTLNISGGVAGGDEMTTHIQLDVGAQALVASLAAEKVYGALAGEAARISTQIQLDEATSLDYLPQETILFDHHHLIRKLDVQMHPSARYLGTESLVFGRVAMGEVLNSGYLRDQIAISRGGKLLFQDMTRLEGDIAARLASKALAGGANALGTVIFVAPEATSYLDSIRDRLLQFKCEGGASAFDGMVLVRLLGGSAASLREAIAGVLETFLNGRALPRVWQS